MANTHEVHTFVREIAGYGLPNVFNPWSDIDTLDIPGGSGALKRRIRLTEHLDVDAKYLLIGEAPGYQGCHFSGVPFTSERVLLDGRVPRVDCPQRITTSERPWKEPSATIVWGALHELGIAEQVVLWNAFAWHPHEEGNRLSNRTPTRDELIAGAPVLVSLVNLFPAAKVVAIGKKAEWILSQLLLVPAVGVVRHPANGGAKLFRDGLKKIVEGNHVD